MRIRERIVKERKTRTSGFKRGAGLLHKALHKQSDNLDSIPSLSTNLQWKYESCFFLVLMLFVRYSQAYVTFPALLLQWKRGSLTSHANKSIWQVAVGWICCSWQQVHQLICDFGALGGFTQQSIWLQSFPLSYLISISCLLRLQCRAGEWKDAELMT